MLALRTKQHSHHVFNRQALARLHTTEGKSEPPADAVLASVNSHARIGLIDISNQDQVHS